MPLASPRLDRWSSIVAHVSSQLDLDASARLHRALLRKRGVASAEALLHLTLLYGPGGLSLRATAGFAAEARIADLGDVSLLGRLRNCGDFLADVLGHLLAERRGEQPGEGRSRLQLVDGSTVSVPGSDGSDWRLHARYETARGCFSDLTLTDARTAEALDRVAVKPGDVLVQDRGYAKEKNFRHAVANGADFIVRTGWRSVRLFHSSGKRFDLIGALSDTGPEVVEHAVRIGTGRHATAARLVIARKPPEIVARQHVLLKRAANKKGVRTDPRTLRAAGFMMILTSLPGERADAAAIVALYRMRWQIELAFKRIKSLGGFDDLRASDPRLARTWLLAHLIAVVLIEASLDEDLDSPP